MGKAPFNILITALTVFISFLIPTQVVHALTITSSPQVVTPVPANPDGENGWYKTAPTISVSTHCDATIGGYANIPIGVHKIQLYYLNSVSYEQIDNNSPTYTVGYCGTTPPPIPTNLGDPVYSNIFKVDSAFQVTFKQPTNNSNLTQSTIPVTVTSNSVSGFSTVNINGVNATINSDGTATATIPLNKGLNTITANATSIGGFTSTSSITVLLTDPVNTPTSSTSPISVTTPSPTTTSTNSSPSHSTQNTTLHTNQTIAKNSSKFTQVLGATKQVTASPSTSTSTQLNMITNTKPNSSKSDRNFFEKVWDAILNFFKNFKL